MFYRCSWHPQPKPNTDLWSQSIFQETLSAKQKMNSSMMILSNKSKSMSESSTTCLDLCPRSLPEIWYKTLNQHNKNSLSTSRSKSPNRRNSLLNKKVLSCLSSSTPPLTSLNWQISCLQTTWLRSKLSLMWKELALSRTPFCPSLNMSGTMERSPCQCFSTRTWPLLTPYVQRVDRPQRNWRPMKSNWAWETITMMP